MTATVNWICYFIPDCPIIHCCGKNVALYQSKLFFLKNIFSEGKYKSILAAFFDVQKSQKYHFSQKPLTIFAKKTIVTVRLRSKYASVIINLILTSATQLYGKITKINEIFTVTHHFFQKLIQKRIKKSLHLSGVLFDCTQKQIHVN